MIAMGYDTGKFSPCLYHSSAVAMSVFRHGDDFVVSGTRTQQKDFEEQLSKHLIVKHLATLGPCTALGDVTEVRILNSIVRWVKLPYSSGRERIEYEVDPRHAEWIIHQLGLSSSSRSASTPSEKSKLELVAQQCGSHSVSISHVETVILRWTDLICNSHQKNWHDGWKHRQLEALKRAARYLFGSRVRATSRGTV